MKAVRKTWNLNPIFAEKRPTHSASRWQRRNCSLQRAIQEGARHTPPGKFLLRYSPCVPRQGICPQPGPLLWAPPPESHYHIVRVRRLLGSLWNETWPAGTRGSKELLLGFPSSLEQIISKITKENFLIVIQVEGAANKSSTPHTFVGHKTLWQ